MLSHDGNSSGVGGGAAAESLEFLSTTMSAMLEHASVSQGGAIAAQVTAIAGSPISQSYSTMKALIQHGFAMLDGAPLDEYFGKLWWIMQGVTSEYRDVFTSSQEPWLMNRGFSATDLFLHLHGDPSARTATARHVVEEVIKRAKLGMFTTILIIGAGMGEDAKQLAALLSARGVASRLFSIRQRDVCRYPMASEEVEVVTGNGMDGVDPGEIDILAVSWVTGNTFWQDLPDLVYSLPRIGHVC